MPEIITSSFLKWAGGKKRLVVILDKLTPKYIERYFEPFLGSGAFFFYLVQTKKKFKATLSDSNFELINTYKELRDNTNDLIEICMDIRQIIIKIEKNIIILLGMNMLQNTTPN